VLNEPRLGWRWAFLIQMPVFLISFVLTYHNLNYVTGVCFLLLLERLETYSNQGTGKSTKEMLKRIDWLGAGTLLMAVGAMLVFLSVRYNASFPVRLSAQGHTSGANVANSFRIRLVLLRWFFQLSSSYSS
jgi:hypothetical protein